MSQGETGTGGSPSSLHGIVSTQLVQVWLSSSNSPRHLLLSKPSYLKFVLFLHFFFMWMVFCLHLCLCITWVPGGHGGRKGMGPSGTVVIAVGAGRPTGPLGKQPCS